jgi:hypothetical protein
LHIDFTPGRQKPPTIPPRARTKKIDDIWSWTAFLRMYLEYVLAKKHRHRPEYDWIILGGEFLEDIRHMSEILMYEGKVVPRMERHAEEVCCKLQPGEIGTFEAGGNQLITSDFSSTHVALSLGRFYVWFEARGKVGPNIKGHCSYEIEIEWTLKDNYDFDLWERNWLTKFITSLFQFYRFAGNEYRVIGTWKSKITGTAICPVSSSSGMPGPSTAGTPGMPSEEIKRECTKTFSKNGTGRIYSDYMGSRDAAVLNAKSLLMERAQLEAGLEFNKFTCPPNYPCQVKYLEDVTATIEDINISCSLMASFFYMEWRYQAVIAFNWSAYFVCRRN